MKKAEPLEFYLKEKGKKALCTQKKKTISFKKQLEAACVYGGMETQTRLKITVA